ncbi:MAG: creatininase family protein, partial [Candidatus Aerophobetes bacterium]|nr:creatininase family protein [Candidatus Aerophobetes bacterium]
VGHAEEIEGSQMLYKYPHLADISKVKDYTPEERELYHIDPGDHRDTLYYVPGTEETTRKIAEISGGSVGCPSLASPEKGKEYHKHLVSRLVEVIEQLKG